MYNVTFAPGVIDYINSRDYLTENDRVRLISGIHEELGRDADDYLRHRSHTMNPNCFWYDFGLMTEELVFRNFFFWCDSGGRVYSVVQVLYAEEMPQEVENDGIVG